MRRRPGLWPVCPALLPCSDPAPALLPACLTRHSVAHLTPRPSRSPRLIHPDTSPASLPHHSARNHPSRASPRQRPAAFAPKASCLPSPDLLPQSSPIRRQTLAARDIIQDLTYHLDPDRALSPYSPSTRRLRRRETPAVLLEPDSAIRLPHALPHHAVAPVHVARLNACSLAPQLHPHQHAMSLPRMHPPPCKPQATTSGRSRNSSST